MDRLQELQMEETGDYKALSRAYKGFIDWEEQVKRKLEQSVVGENQVAMEFKRMKEESSGEALTQSKVTYFLSCHNKKYKEDQFKSALEENKFSQLVLSDEIAPFSQYSSLLKTWEKEVD